MATNDIIATEIWKTNFIDKKSYDDLTESLAFWDDDTWDKESAKGSYDFIVVGNGKYYTVFPSPPPPDEYDPKYKPDFLIFGSIDAEAQDKKIDEIGDTIKADVVNLVITTVSLGVAGLFCLLIIVCVVAQFLTQPLTWMESKAWEIVNHTNERVGDSLIVVQGDEKNPLALCMPKTELQEIVSEFRSMITGFSGEEASRVAAWRGTETRNVVTWKEEFQYKLKDEMKMMARPVSRKMSSRSSGPRLDTADFAKIRLEYDTERNNAGSDSDLKTVQTSGESSTELSSNIATSSASSMKREDCDRSNKLPTRINLGSNLPLRDRMSSEPTIDDPIRIAKSTLYWNLLFWIVLPILISIMAIMTVVGLKLADTAPLWIKDAESLSFQIEFEHLYSSAHLNVKHIEQIFTEPLRDLHVISRITGWLLFGAVNRSSSFTDMEMNKVEDCKFYPDLDECPFQTDNSRSPCACEWNDPWFNRQCSNTPPPSNPRDIQETTMWYINQNRDHNITTGDRNNSLSYPTYDYSPETTSWWTDPDAMPGSNKSSDAEGYLTVYDRLRVGSAAATAIFPVYNAGEDARGSGGLSTTAMSGYISFEADGAFIGYAGCNYDTAAYSQFSSTDANKAYIINPDLCPKGKFGYDPRCRTWYADSKREALNNNDLLYISPPYEFATTDYVMNTAVSALIDPTSGEYVGNVLIDFSSSEINNIVEDNRNEFFAVILPNTTKNVVASSELDDNATPESIFNLMIPFDPPDSVNREHFSSIVDDMEKGGEGHDCDLNRTNKDGVQEEYCYAYLPIYNRELKPVQPDDYSRGAEYSEQLLYSMIMFEKKEELYYEYRMRSEYIENSLESTFTVYFITTSLIALICIVVTATVSSTDNFSLLANYPLGSLTTIFLFKFFSFRSFRYLFMSQSR